MKAVIRYDYSIIIDKDLSDLNYWLSKQDYTHYYILLDENTNEFCWPIFENQCPFDNCHKIIIPSGEKYKNIQTCELIWKHLLQFKADRNALIINLGGGVIGDMGGFAASCYKRGIDFINVPTTILAQVDASIGGKLGVDFENGKNLIGLFKNPKRVHIATCFHDTLPEKQIKNGFAEIYKHALIGDQKQWEYFKTKKLFIDEDIEEVLYQSLLIKKRIVEFDPFEEGMRKALNFGHTIGHAIETYSLENDEIPLLHGEAVIIGMIAESYISVQKAGLKKEHLEEILQIFKDIYLYYPIDLNKLGQIWDYMLLDKKNVATRVFAALISDFGEPVINVEITFSDLSDSLVFYNDSYS